MLIFTEGRMEMYKKMEGYLKTGPRKVEEFEWVVTVNPLCPCTAEGYLRSAAMIRDLWRFLTTRGAEKDQSEVNPQTSVKVKPKGPIR